MNIKENLKEIFRDILDIDDLVLENETSADDIEEWDSLTHINLIVAIEQEFKIKFGLGELQSMKNIGEMIDIISSKLNK